MGCRNYPRTEVSIPIEFHVRRIEATEEPWIGMGVLADLSLTGIFFFPDNQSPLKQGDIRDFTFALPRAIEGFSRPSIIKARGKVMRSNQRGPYMPWSGGGFSDRSIFRLTYKYQYLWNLRFNLDFSPLS